MSKISTSIIGGIAGATALNIIHQVVKQFDDEAPHVDKVGEEALSKSLISADIKPPQGNSLFAATLAADLLSNAAYYSIIGLAKRKHLMATGVITGLAAGIGAVTLTGKLGLNDSPVTRTLKTKVLTVAWYTLGGIIAAGTIKALKK